MIPTQIKPNPLFLQGEAKRLCCFLNPIKDTSSWQNTWKEEMIPSRLQRDGEAKKAL